LKNIAEILMTLMRQSDEAALQFVKNRLFAGPESLGKDEKNFFESICTHLEQDVRETASTLFVFVIGRLHDIGGD